MNQEYIIRRILREVANICKATGAFKLSLTVDTYNPVHVNLLNVLEGNGVLIEAVQFYMQLAMSVHLPVPFARELVFYYEPNTPQKITIKSDVSIISTKLDSKIQKAFGANNG